MNTATIESFRRRLLNRRDAVLVTITYIEREHKSYEENAQWRDRLTKKRRLGLPDYLSDGYKNEKAAIENALDRMLANSYGSCVKCNWPIGSGWLEAFPATESCFSCCRQVENTRDQS
jgi:RNA polymerase-binding transcription factor DksA